MKKYPKPAYVLANLWYIYFLMSLQNNGIFIKREKDLTPGAKKI